MRADDYQQSGWCILRTSGPRTLALTRSLETAGFEAWTPRLTRRWRKPRSREMAERDAPIIPSFVFIAARQMPDLYRAMSTPGSGLPQFSIFTHAGRVPVLLDCQMVTLRAEEDRAAAAYRTLQERERQAALKGSKPAPPIGTKVKMASGALFGGMTGTVEGKNGSAAVVNFGGGLAFTIEAWLLERVDA